MVAGALVFGTVMAVLQVNLRKTVMERGSVMMENLGANADQFKQLMDKANGGDSDAAQELAKQMADLGSKNAADMVGAQMAGVAKGMFPSLGMAAVLSALVGVLSATYFILLALRQQSADVVASSIPSLALPMIGLWIWTFIRSFAWIPLIGVVFALYYYPRFLAAPIFLVEQDKGVFDSVKMSLQSTEYYWGKIMGNVLTLGLLFVIASIICGLVIGAIFGPASYVTIWATSVISQIFAGIGSVFAMKLAKTVMANPLRPARA